MGLLKRLRASSSAHARPELDTAPPLPLPSTAPLYASSSRASLTGSDAPSSHWSHTQQTASAPAKASKGFWKRKGKGKEREVQGFSYESTAPTTTSFAIDRSQSNLQQAGPRQNGYPQHLRQVQSRPDGAGYRDGAGAYEHLTPGPARGTWDEAELETPKPAQYTPPTPRGILKSRGMLGKLDFEQDSSTDEEKLSSSQVIPQHRHSSFTPPDPMQSTQPYSVNRPLTTTSYQNLATDRSARDTAQEGAPPRMSQEEPVERLISPEKKPAWTPGARRMSRSSEPDEPVSPYLRELTLWL